MGLLLQKKKISETILNSIEDIKLKYITMYGKPIFWDGMTKNLYMLNCDCEIQAFLQKKKVDIHETVFEEGLTFGILIIKNETKMYYEKQGIDLNIAVNKEMMYENIYDFVYNYITIGFSEEDPEDDY